MDRVYVRPVVFQPTAGPAMQRGVNRIANVVRPTLGPIPRLVAIEQTSRMRTPEILDNAALIARRIIEIPDRDEDMGAMFVRHLLWQLHEETGDGTATAAVLFQSIFNQGLQYVVAGGNAQLLRRYLEQGIQVILDELSRITVPVQGSAALAHAAETICQDPALSAMLGEIFDTIGEYGQLDVRSGKGRELEREYVEGMWWSSGLLSPYMVTDPLRQRADLESAAVLVSDLAIEDPHALVPLLEMLIQAELRTLVIVASRLSESTIGLLLTNRERIGLNIIAVRTPGGDTGQQTAALQDLAIFTGGRPLLQATGASVQQAKLSDLGSSRRAWADQRFFGLVGGGGDPRTLRSHIAALRETVRRAETLEQRLSLQGRIGRFMGGSATLFVGGATELEIAARKELATRTAAAVRGAMMEGVLPGGGVALLACQSVLRERFEQSSERDERMAYRILLNAMEIPARTIMMNAGYDPGATMAHLAQLSPGHGIDVRCGEVVDLARAGVVDVATVQKAAVRSAISGAALALTIDVLIHPTQRQQAVAP